MMLYTMIFWWPRTSGAKKRPGKVSRSCMQHMDGNTFISQQQALKSQQRVKATVKLSAMEKVRRVVYRTFKCSFSHGPVLKPKPNHIRYCCFKTQFEKELDLCFIVSGKTRAGLWPFLITLSYDVSYVRIAAIARDEVAIMHKKCTFPLSSLNLCTQHMLSPPSSFRKILPLRQKDRKCTGGVWRCMNSLFLPRCRQERSERMCALLGFFLLSPRIQEFGLFKQGGKYLCI